MSLIKKLKSLFPPPRPKPPEMPPGYTLIVRRPGEFSFITANGTPSHDEGDLAWAVETAWAHHRIVNAREKRDGELATHSWRVATPEDLR